ncbi:MAG: isocitrate lyase/PEP mutase family protein [Pseudolabrys sp.]|nr:isocitrate lyase/PEP mutase family protein [Pseudolabrys sp.]
MPGPSKAAVLRELYRSQQPLVCPIAHDALSVRLVEQAGFKAFNIGGNSLLAARYALPDLGIGALGEMAAGIADVVGASELPCIADGDDGYGDVKSVVRLINVYESMGVAGVLLEDQLRDGKQPGAAAARGVAPIDKFENKLRAAMDARRDKDFVIIGRTDSFGAVGIDEALKRGERFLKAGCDGVFVAGIKTIPDFERVGRAFKGQWNVAAIFQGMGTPMLPPSELMAMGFSQIVFPNILIGRVAKAVEQGLSRLRDFASGKADAFKDSDAELALKSLSEAVNTGRWNSIESKYS